MSETLNPTTSEFLTALPLVDNGVVVALNEIVRRLEANMPDCIDALNTARSATGSSKVPKPKGYAIAPANLTDDYINHILVSAATSTVAHSPSVFRNETQIIIYSIDRRIESTPQVRVAWDRSAVIRGILYHFLTGCEDADGRSCWQKLEPTGVTMLPEQWEQYSGTACSYTMVQANPDANNWS